MSTCDQLTDLNYVSRLIREKGVAAVNKLFADCGVVRKAVSRAGVLINGQALGMDTQIWRSTSGLREGVIVTSNGYIDREREHVATEALKEYVRGCYDDAGNWKGNNRLLFYHGLDIGEVVAAGVVEGFLVEIVREKSGFVPETIWDYWQDTGDNNSVQWGASHGFTAARQGDTFVHIGKKETTVLDVADAANLATYSEVVKMNESKHLDAAFAKRGIPNASRLIAEKGVGALADTLRQSKAIPSPERIEALRAEIAKLDGQIAAIDEHNDLLDELNQLLDELEELEGMSSESRGLSNSGEFDPMFPGMGIKMDPATARQVAHQRAVQAQTRKSVNGMDPFFGNMNVPLKK